MSASAQVTITPTILERAEVNETFVNGPMNVSGFGSTATITFTVIRPDLAQGMAGGAVTHFIAPVAARVTMPIETAIELKKLLNQTLPDLPGMSVGSMMKQ